MSIRSGGGGGRAPRVGSRCSWILQRNLAITLVKRGLLQNQQTQSKSPSKEVGDHASSFWMYDSGYLVFQSFLDANSKCFWNPSLMEAVRVLEFQGYVAPGVLLVTANPCALEIIRSAWSRNVLKPPANYSISALGDVEDCLVQPISQGQFTPLPEALCWVILDLTSSGQAAVLENIRATLRLAFPDMECPSEEIVYDALAKLMTDKVVYQTSRGYFVVTPETRRLYSKYGSSSSSSLAGGGGGGRSRYARGPYEDGEKPLLLSPDEALVRALGDMETIRDGDLTHQAVQTNLADIICKGNPNDKVLYARKPSKRSQSLPPRKLERRHSLRISASSKRQATLQRSGSLKYIPTETTIKSDRPVTKRSTFSLLTRFFRSSLRLKQNSSLNLPFSNQSPPPTEWFNKSVAHLHSVGTQTCNLSETGSDSYLGRSYRSFQSWDMEDQALSRSSTLSRHRKHHDLSSSVVTSPQVHTPRRAPHSATLPRRLIGMSSLQSASNHPSPAASQLSIPQTTASIGSAKSVIESRGLCSPVAKSMSSSSSGYNSLPRSTTSKHRFLNYNPQSPYEKPKLSGYSTPSESSFTVKVLSQNGQGSNRYCSDNQPNGNLSYKSTVDSSSNSDHNSTTLTTTINGGNKTRIFVQQQNSPVRSLITLENGYPKKGSSEKPNTDNIIILNGGSLDRGSKHSLSKETHRPQRAQNERPSSLYSKETNLDDFMTVDRPKFSESHMKMKFPSTETIQLEEKCLDSLIDGKTKPLNATSPWKETEMKINGLIDAMSLSSFSSETQLNNARKASLVTKPLVSSDRDKLIDSISYKNLLKDSAEDPDQQKKNIIRSRSPSPTKSCNDLTNPVTFPLSSFASALALLKQSTAPHGKLDMKSDEIIFPDLNDFPLNFTSLAAQNILNGISLNSVDTLVEVNMAADKLNKNNIDSTQSDLGLV
nr:PREDICTED: uncharacterized protein LOC109029682 [Bemisia tabaci]